MTQHFIVIFRGDYPNAHLAVDAHGMPVRILIISATTADCTQGTRLIEGLSAEHLLADATIGLLAPSAKFALSELPTIMLLP